MAWFTAVGPGLRDGRTASRSPGGAAAANDLEEVIECIRRADRSAVCTEVRSRDSSVPNVGSGVLDVAN